MTNLNFISLYPLWPELMLALFAFIFTVFGAFRGNTSTEFILKYMAGLFAFIAVLLIGLPAEKVSALNEMFVFDRFAIFTKIVIAVGMILVCGLTSRYLREEGLTKFEYPVLMVLAALGMFMMVSANHMMSLYVGLELQSLSLYVLAAFRSKSLRSTEAGLKYFILGAISSGLILFGISLIYGFSGTLSYNEIAAQIATLEGAALTGLVFGLVFLLSGIAFKVSAVPFHMWTPDVYDGAPTSVTAFFAMVPKIAAMALLVRLLSGPFEAVFDQWQVIIIFLSIMSMLWGAFAGLAQQNLKRLMAYSSIGNIGYALMGVATGTAEGYAATFYYLIIYMMMTAGVFALLMFMRREGRALSQIDDLKGLSAMHPKAAYAMTFFMFSLSGIPPLAGFFGKLFVFEMAVNEGLFALAIIGVLSSVVAAAYYLRIIKVMVFDHGDEPFDNFVSKGRKLVLATSLIFTLGLIFMPAHILSLAKQSTQTLGLYADTQAPEADVDLETLKDEPGLLDN